MTLMTPSTRKRPGGCKRCGRPASARNVISRRGVCAACSILAMSRQWVGSGMPAPDERERWAQAMIRSYHKHKSGGVVDPRMEGVARRLRSEGYDV